MCVAFPHNTRRQTNLHRKTEGDPQAASAPNRLQEVEARVTEKDKPVRPEGVVLPLPPKGKGKANQKRGEPLLQERKKSLHVTTI